MGKTMRSAKCGICGGARYYLVYQNRPTRSAESPANRAYAISEIELEKPNKVVRCMSCGIVYAMSSETLSQITRDYETMEDSDYLLEEKGRREQARIVLSQIRKFKKHGRILDIGCGPGFFLDEARKQGWEVSGVDLSSWSKGHCKDHFAIDIHRGVLETAGFSERSFDAVVMNDFIEHVSDPKATLEEVRRILKNDGVIYLSTPDIESALSRALRAKWWGINKYHLFYFSKKTLERLFQIVGFKSLHYYPYPRVFSLNYWVKRLRPYPVFIRAPFEFFSRIGNSGDRLLNITLHDQLGVIARKIQRLDSVSTQEGLPPVPAAGKAKITVVLPAYNAEKTLERTVADIPKDTIGEIILVDDKSRDNTVRIAKKLGLVVFQHDQNRGYGANQKTCYNKAIERGANVVVMVHPDYQYDPAIIPDLVEPILSGRADAVFGSRMMKGGALEGGMPLWKHNANILLTAFENVMLGTYLTEYHSGFRAYRTAVLKKIDYRANSDGFLFDTQIIVQLVANRFKIEEIPIRTRYFEEASSIRLWPSILYGFGIIRVMLAYLLHAQGIWRDKKLELETHE